MDELELVGGGSMGAALLHGLLSHGLVSADQVSVVEVSAERRQELSLLFPGVSVTAHAVGAAQVIVATKPNHVVEALTALRNTGVRRVLSIAAGINLASLQSAIGPNVAVIRAMPNTPALVGEGAAAMSGGSTASEADLVWAELILDAVGIVVRVPESQLDAVTAVSGSGPAYVFLIAEAMIEAGVSQGLDRSTADALVRQTLLGSARLLIEGEWDPAELRSRVASPGGTTEAALQVLQAGKLQETLIDAIDAATKRSQELAE
ncbi:MAG: pyrroline-5-carboxylate reductase [Microthrixaceae bacterium]